ncbi:MAG: NUDIX domain-containing protein [Candidatus Micrarchaeota archaeon]|nr:NUDIX domain-containing protein [Candidatus Micrarchaeota archaeon]
MEKIKTDLTVGACIVNESKVLLVLHAKLNKWLFPGGHIENNETPDEAVIREVKEETGLSLKLLDYGKILETPDVIKRLAIPFYSNLHSVGDHNHYCAFYLGNVENNKIIKNIESKEIKWFSLEEIERLDNVPKNVKLMAAFGVEKVK